MVVSFAQGQSTCLPQDHKHTQFLNRLEILMRDYPALNVSTPRPFSRRLAAEAAIYADSLQHAFRARPVLSTVQGSGMDSVGSLTAIDHDPGSRTFFADSADDHFQVSSYPNASSNLLIRKPDFFCGGVIVQSAFPGLSPVDEYNLHSLLMNNSEWYNGDQSSFTSKRRLPLSLYSRHANLYEVNTPDFFLAINPVLQEQQSVETGNSQRIFLNSRGLTLRGMIAHRLGFYTSLVENLERPPLFVQNRILATRAIPGAGRYNAYKTTGFDYSDARGGITFNAAKYLDFQFAYDRNFIGNGYRSLFLSDFSSNYLFLKINTRIWKFNYENIFMELNPQFPQAVRDQDRLLDKKYAAVHHLSVNVTNWLNVGLFEAVIFGRKNHFDFLYLNPILFLRTAEKQNNSPDNGFVGFDFKANLAHRAQLYGQFLFDELIIKELRSGKGWHGNKFGIQAGGKYLNLFGVDNLDLQGELNLVRPFTYSHYDSTASYGHYNQPLAHPLGANFIEGIAIIRYQPMPKVTASARLIVWKQGVDTGNANYGSNIFKLYTTRSGGDYGYGLPSGTPSTGVNLQLLASYEIRENLYVDGSLLVRNWKTANNLVSSSETRMFTVGLRLNMFRREYDY